MYKLGKVIGRWKHLKTHFGGAATHLQYQVGSEHVNDKVSDIDRWNKLFMHGGSSARWYLENPSGRQKEINYHRAGFGNQYMRELLRRDLNNRGKGGTRARNEYPPPAGYGGSLNDGQPVYQWTSSVYNGCGEVVTQFYHDEITWTPAQRFQPKCIPVELISGRVRYLPDRGTNKCALGGSFSYWGVR